MFNYKYLINYELHMGKNKLSLGNFVRNSNLF